MKLFILTKGKTRPIGYISPGGYKKTATGWRKVTKRKDDKGVATKIKRPSPKASVASPEAIASEIKDTINKLNIRGRGRYGYQGIKYLKDFKEFTILFDTPREMRHPEDYERHEVTETEKRLEEDEYKIWPLIHKLEKKYSKYEFRIAADVSHAISM